MATTVTVVMPLYNKEEYVADAINSVLNQTIQDFELVIVDDASTDDSMRIVERFTDERIVTLYNGKNRGVGFTVNRGVEEAKGKYIALIGADDMYRPTKLERQLELSARFPDGVIYTDCLRISHEGTPLKKGRLPMEEGFVFPGLLTGTFPFPGFLTADATMMFRRDDFTKVGGINENLKYGEGYDLALRLSTFRLFYPVREPLYVYRRDRQSLTLLLSDRFIYSQILWIINSNYDRSKYLLNKEQLWLARMRLAQYSIMSRSYAFVLRKIVSDPPILASLMRHFYETYHSRPN
jgi:glycosyltransferase involved in cell wall biosynthesis